jgi:hypothetical protein
MMSLGPDAPPGAGTGPLDGGAPGAWAAGIVGPFAIGIAR